MEQRDSKHVVSEEASASGSGAGSGEEPAAAAQKQGIIRGSDGRDATHEMSVLTSCTAQDFTVGEVLGSGQMGMVVRVQCTKPGHPIPTKDYALKVVFNFGATTYSMVRNLYTAEYETVSSLKRHPNIVPYWAQFRDAVPDAIISVLPDEVKRIVTTNDAGRARRTPLRTQFVLFEYCGRTLKAWRAAIDEDVLPEPQLISVAGDIVNATLHLDRNDMVHRDLKLDNVMVTDDGTCQLVDFGMATRVDPETRTIPFHSGMLAGGNIAHLAPEVLTVNNAAARATSEGSYTMHYAKQAVFAVGVLLSEVAVGEHPIPNYPDGYSDSNGVVRYDDGDIVPLPDEYPHELVDLVRRMVLCDPDDRPSLADAVDVLAKLMRDEPTPSASATRILFTQLSTAEERIGKALQQVADAKAETAAVREELAAAQAALAEEKSLREAVEAQLAELQAGGGRRRGSKAVRPPALPLAEVMGQVTPVPGTNNRRAHLTAASVSETVNLVREAGTEEQLVEGCKAIRAISKTGARSMLVEAGAVPALAVALQDSVDSEPVVQAALSALRDIAVNVAAKERIGQSEVVVDGEDVRVLVLFTQAMAAHLASQTVQEAGCGLLWELTYSNQANKSRVRRYGGLKALLDAMKQHQDSPVVQMKALGALFNMAVIGENKQAIREQEGIAVILEALRRHKREPLVQTNAAWALWNMSAGSQHNRNEIFSEGGVEALVDSIKANMEHADVCDKAIGVLDNLAVDGTIKSELIAKLGLGVVLQAMKVHVEKLAVLESGAGVLWSVSFSSEETRSLVVRSGGVDRLAAAMKRHPAAAVLQENCCGCIWNLASSPAHKEVIGAAGLINLILAAMKAHPQRMKLQKNACAALWELTFLNGENKTRIAAGGGIRLVLTAIANHTDSALVLQKALGVLFNLAVNAENKREVAEAGGVRLVVRAMAAHSTDPIVQCNACWALWNLAAGSGSNRKLICDEGAIPHVLKAMQSHLRDPTVQQKAAGVLDNLAVRVENRGLITKNGGIPILLRAMQEHMGELSVQQNGCGALWNLAVYGENKAAIERAGGIQVILEAMKRHVDVALLQHYALGALRNLAVNDKNKRRIREFDGIQQIFEAMQRHEVHAGVQEQGCVTLANLAREGSNLASIRSCRGASIVRNAMRLHPHNQEVQEQGKAALSLIG